MELIRVLHSALPCLQKSKLPSAFQGTNTDSIEVKTEIFASTMFRTFSQPSTLNQLAASSRLALTNQICLVILTSAPGLPDQKTLQKLVVEHGGDFRVSLQNIDTKLKEDEVVLIVVKSKSTFLFLAVPSLTESSHHAESFDLLTSVAVAKSRPYESRPYDQVTPHWIVDSIKARRALPLFKK